MGHILSSNSCKISQEQNWAHKIKQYFKISFVGKGKEGNKGKK